ncbi:MAG: family 20 glycosylhydrolase, partial [Acutalibacteraceae bacterium]
MESKKRIGVMLDCSRNAVMKPSSVKNYMDILSKMGYNMLMLYTEDTYEVEDEPFFGYLRGRYSENELKDIADYGEQVGIEVIPCIQTLAHLNQIFRWSCYKSINDTEDILLADCDRTYELIEKMFKSIRRCFKTDIVHIGMDEAHNVGLGKYFKEHGPVDRFSLLSRHLKRVSEIAERYGFKPIMWSDMFFRLANGGDYYCSRSDIVTDDIAALVPENVSLVYWD